LAIEHSSASRRAAAATPAAAEGPDRGRVGLCYGGFLAVFVFTAVLLAVREPFPTALDELPHYSYVATMAQAPALLPDYAAMRLVDPARPPRFTDKPNYLNHPALYYLLLSPVLRLAPGTVLPLRLANVAIAALGVMLLFLAASRRFATVAQHAVFAGLVTGFPKLAVLASNVNNDNLAFLGGAVVTVGLLREEEDLAMAALVGGGFVLGAVAKLTGALMLGLLILIWYAPLIRRIGRSHLAVLAPLLAIGVLPYLANLLRYGTPLWEASARAHGALPGTWHAPLSFGEFLWVFFETVPEQWAAVGPSDPIELAGALAVVAVFAASLRRSRLARCVLAALLCTLAVHVGYEYRDQLRLGIWPGSYGAQPRYYLPLWPGVAVGCAVAIGRLRRDRLRSAAAAAFLVLLAYGFPVVAAIRYPLLHGP
jgi:hypothetical protein